MQTIPFKRAMIMIHAMQSIIANVPESLQRIALSKLGEYKSRGHGLGKLGKSYNKSTNWKALDIIPGCGKRECARRHKQMSKHLIG